MIRSRWFQVATALALTASASGCSKSKASPTSGAGSTTAPASAPAETAATPPAQEKPAFVQKGIPDGKIVIGYIQPVSDESECGVVTDKPENKAKWEKEGAEIAKMFKSKVVDACPTDAVVGTCSAGFGVLVNYSGPKYTAETAKADCEKDHGKWFE